MPTPFNLDLALSDPALWGGQLFYAYRNWSNAIQVASAGGRLPDINGRHFEDFEGLALAFLISLRGLNTWIAEEDEFLRRLLCRREYNELDPFVEGDGLCTAYAMDYVHARRAGALPVAILRAMRAEASRNRFVGAQRKFRRIIAAQAQAQVEPAQKRSWMKAGEAALPAEYAVYAAQIRAAQGELALAPAEFMRGMEQRPRVLGRVDTTVTIMGLLGAWPENIPLPWRPVRGFTAAAQTPGRVRDKKEWPHLGRTGLLSFHEWYGNIRRLLTLASTDAYGQLVIVRLDRAPDVGHFIVIDLSPRQPGIFDNNFGFMPLNPRVALDSYCGWLLALLAYYYHVGAMTLYGLPFLASSPHADLPTLSTLRAPAGAMPRLDRDKKGAPDAPGRRF